MQQIRVISLNTNEQYMKERRTRAENVITREPQRVISGNTNKQNIKERITRVCYVITRQLERVISTDMFNLYTKVENEDIVFNFT